jgi:hypothetical protein
VVNGIVSLRWPGAFGDDEAAVSPRVAAAQALLVLVQAVGYEPGAGEIELEYILPLGSEESRPAGCVFEGSSQTPDVRPIGIWFIASLVWRARSG